MFSAQFIVEQLLQWLEHDKLYTDFVNLSMIYYSKNYDC